jgi:hypothetical protein
MINKLFIALLLSGIYILFIATMAVNLYIFFKYRQDMGVYMFALTGLLLVYTTKKLL